MKWTVMYHNINKDKIETYNVLAYCEDLIKKLKKKCATKEEFSAAMKREYKYSFCSKCEWELIIKITDDGRVVLSPWVGSRNKDILDVTDDPDFDWKTFAEKHIKMQIYKNEAKIDVFNQLDFVWDSFIEYVWRYHHKYQRKDPKFER